MPDLEKLRTTLLCLRFWGSFGEVLSRFCEGFGGGFWEVSGEFFLGFVNLLGGLGRETNHKQVKQL